MLNRPKQVLLAAAMLLGTSVAFADDNGTTPFYGDSWAATENSRRGADFVYYYNPNRVIIVQPSVDQSYYVAPPGTVVRYYEYYRAPIAEVPLSATQPHLFRNDTGG